MRNVTFVWTAFFFAGVSISRALLDAQKPKDESMTDCPLREQHMAAKKAASARFFHLVPSRL
jgi:hypothetical protein